MIGLQFGLKRIQKKADKVMNINYPEFDKDKDYTALEWFGWARITNNLQNEYFFLISDLTYAEIFNDEEYTILMNDAFFDETKCFIDYCSDRAELEFWRTDIRQGKRDYNKLIHELVLDMGLHAEDQPKFRKALFGSTKMPDYIDLDNYFKWTVIQLKKGIRLYDLPGWGRDI